MQYFSNSSKKTAQKSRKIFQRESRKAGSEKSSQGFGGSLSGFSREAPQNKKSD